MWHKFNAEKGFFGKIFLDNCKKESNQFIFYAKNIWKFLKEIVPRFLA